MTQEFTEQLAKWQAHLNQLGYRKVVLCKDCKHKIKCFSDVVMIDNSRTADIYENVEWCSLGERETE